MSIKSSTIHSARVSSVKSKSATLLFTNNSYAVTGGSITNSTDIKRYVVVPGQTENVQAITGGDAPTVSSIVVTDASWNPLPSQYIDTVTGGYVEINGSLFDEGVIVYLNGQSLTTIRVDATKLRVVIPPTPAGAYAVMVFNGDNTGTLFSNINLSVAPAFITPAGSLGSFLEFSNVDLLIEANADSTITYTVASGTLPTGVNLNANGTITGTTPGLSSNTNYSFVVSATDEELQAATRSFALTVNPDVVTWITPANNTSIALLLNQLSDNVLISATSLVSSTISYTSETLPTGLSIVAGNITGTPTQLGMSNTTITATSDVTSKTANITLKYKVLEPYVLENYSSNIYGFLSLTNSTFQANIGGGMYFDPSGGNLYYSDDTTTSNSIWQYSMTVPWDITTAYQVGRFNQIQDVTPTGIAFKPDGTKFYMLGLASDIVYEYSLSTPWTITTSTLSGQFSVSAQETNPQSIEFSDDGTKMFILGTTGDDVNVYTLSTPWQANTAVFSGVFVPSNSATLSAPTGLAFNSTGTRMYITSASAGVDAIFQYNISPAWDILSSSNVVVKQYNLNPALPRSILIDDIDEIYVKPDGTAIFLLDASLDTIFEYSFDVLDDISSIRPVSNYMNFSGKPAPAQVSLNNFFIKADGTRVYIVAATDKVDEYHLSVPWEAGSGTFQGNSFNFSARESAPEGLFFKPDGTKMYIPGTGIRAIHEFTLSTPWAANTAVYTSNIVVSAQELTPRDVFFKPEGDKMYLVGSSSDRVQEYNLNTPWQVNSAVFVSNVSVAAEDISPFGLTFTPDGTAMFISGQTNDRIYRYNLSTAWQVNTAVANTNAVMNISTTNPQGIKFGKNGFYMYVSAGANTGFNTGPTLIGYRLE